MCVTYTKSIKNVKMPAFSLNNKNMSVYSSKNVILNFIVFGIWMQYKVANHRKPPGFCIKMLY